jgi:hypothetical protein
MVKGKTGLATTMRVIVCERGREPGSRTASSRQ